MKPLFLFMFVTAATRLLSQTIENVDFRALGKTISISYDFLHPKADTSINVALVFKDQQGGSIVPKSISGDIKNVKPGEGKRILWDVLADGIPLSGKYKAEISILRTAPSVKIGSQVWATENLNVDRFRNGDPIPQAKTAEEWQNAGNNQQPAWCYYNNDPKNGEIYGKLYNWYAVNDRRVLAPKGWHIPSDAEWTQLTDFLGGDSIAGAKMKSISGWNDYRGKSGNGTNSSGFNGLPGGFCPVDGTFEYSSIGYSASWWSSTEDSTTNAWQRGLDWRWGEVGGYVYSADKRFGLSVRCVKTNSSVKIGSQVWAAENLNVDCFRNGDPIPQAINDEQWKRAGDNKQPAWCYYNNDPNNGEAYGKLYNWYAVNDRRGLAPQGWHIPSDAEWTQLTDFLGGETIAGAKMKSTSGWIENGNGTNTSGFNGLPGGYRYNDAKFGCISGWGFWWSSTEHYSNGPCYRSLLFYADHLEKWWAGDDSGYSVRCVKD
jgi:uncharacterized protein (TIGR02145 family)